MKNLFLCMIVVLALSAVPAFGNFYWTNSQGDNNLANPLNYSGTGTTAIFTLEGADKAVLSAGDSADFLWDRNVSIGRSDAVATGNGEVEIHGSTISFSRALRLGDNGYNGTLLMTAGTMTAGRAANIGQGAGSTGIWNFQGGTFNAPDAAYDVDVARPGATGVLNMSGSAAMNVAGKFLMLSGGASVNMSDDAVINAGQLYLNGGGLMTLSDDAAVNIAGGVSEVATFDFAAAFGGLINWDAVLGKIAFNGGSFAVAGAGETLGGNYIDFAALLNAAIGNGVIYTDVAGMSVVAQYDAVDNFTALALVPEPATLVLLGLGSLTLLRKRK